jgi:hypothetical protein
MSILFTICTKCDDLADNHPIILENVKAIDRYHPGSSVTIIDSCSKNKKYMSDIMSVAQNIKLEIEDICNKNYEYGAFLYSYTKNKHLYDLFIFIQDSLILTGSLDQQINKIKDDTVCILGAHHYNGCDGCDSIMDTSKINYPTHLSLTLWNSFIINKVTFQKVVECPLFLEIKEPINKNGSRGWERAWTILWNFNNTNMVVDTTNIAKQFLNRN